MCQSDDDAALGFETHFLTHANQLIFVNIDDSYYLARNQRKGKLIVPSSTGLDLHDPHCCRVHAVDASYYMPARIFDTNWLPIVDSALP